MNNAKLGTQELSFSTHLEFASPLKDFVSVITKGKQKGQKGRQMELDLH